MYMSVAYTSSHIAGMALGAAVAMGGFIWAMFYRTSGKALLIIAACLVILGLAMLVRLGQ